MLTIGCPQQVCAGGELDVDPEPPQQQGRRARRLGEDRVPEARRHQCDPHAQRPAERRSRTAVNCWVLPQGVTWSSPAVDTSVKPGNSRGQLVVGVAHDGQPAARRRAVGTEGGHHDAAARVQAALERGAVVVALVVLGEEVEDGPVVPQRELPARDGSRGRPRRRGPRASRRPRAGRAPSAARWPTGRWRSGRGSRARRRWSTSVDQPAPTSMTGSVAADAGLVDQAERELGHGLPPGDAVDVLVVVDPLPEVLAGCGVVGRQRSVASALMTRR